MAESPAPRTRRSFYLIHRWTGLVVGYLALLVFFTGVVAVFSHELADWAERDQPHHDLAELAASGQLDRILETTRAELDPDAESTIQIRAHGRGYVHVSVTRDGEHDGPQAQLRRVDPSDGRIVTHVAGESPDAFFANVTAREALERFLLDLHIRLLMPGQLGLWVTGIAGFALMLLLGTGVYVHWPSRRRVLEAPRRDNERKLLGDLHTSLGFWSVPFTALLGFTGAFFSLAGSLLIPLFAYAAYGGDVEQLAAAVRAPLEVPAADELAPLRVSLADAHERAGMPIDRIRLEHGGDDHGYALMVSTGEPGWGMSYRRFVYDAQTGEFARESPGIGAEPTFATTLLQLVGVLHFGTLAGFSTKLLWFLLGLLTCVLAGTGFALWAVRDRKKNPGRGDRALGAVSAASVAMPLAIAVVIHVWAVSLQVGFEPKAVLGWAFFGTLVVAAGVGASLPPWTAMRGLLGISALAFAALPLAGWWAIGVSPEVAHEAVAVDVGFVATAALLAVLAFRIGRLRRMGEPSESAPEETDDAADMRDVEVAALRDA